MITEPESLLPAGSFLLPSEQEAPQEAATLPRHYKRGRKFHPWNCPGNHRSPPTPGPLAVAPAPQTHTNIHKHTSKQKNPEIFSSRLGLCWVQRRSADLAAAHSEQRVDEQVDRVHQQTGEHARGHRLTAQRSKPRHRLRAARHTENKPKKQQTLF